MQNKLVLSKHSISRMKERSGISSNSSEKMAKRAFNNGIRPKQTSGLLKQWIMNRRLDKSTTLCIYAGMAYIFKDNTLVTTILIPEEINNNIEQYVDEDAWIKYEKYRKNLRKIKEDDSNGKIAKFRFVRIDRKTVKVMVNRYFADNNIPFFATNVTRTPKDYYIVHFVSDDQDQDKLYMRQIREWGEKERNIKLILKRNKNPDGSYATLVEK